MTNTIHILTRDGRVNLFLERWCRRQGLVPEIITSPYSVVEGRNASIVDFLDGADDGLIQLDDDTVPDDDTLPILTTEEDVAWCACPPRNGKVCGGFMPGCARYSRRVLEMVSPPWFRPRVDGLGVRCGAEEAYLLSQVSAPVRVGSCGHLVEMIAKICDGRVGFAWACAGE